LKGSESDWAEISYMCDLVIACISTPFYNFCCWYLEPLNYVIVKFTTLTTPLTT